MRNKMITLDPTAYEYASNMDNFSAFVRDCIHAHARGESIEAVIRQRNYWKAQYDALNSQFLGWDLQEEVKEE